MSLHLCDVKIDTSFEHLILSVFELLFIIIQLWLGPTPTENWMKLWSFDWTMRKFSTRQMTEFAFDLFYFFFLFFSLCEIGFYWSNNEMWISLRQMSCKHITQTQGPSTVYLFQIPSYNGNILTSAAKELQLPNHEIEMRWNEQWAMHRKLHFVRCSIRVRP